MKPYIGMLNTMLTTAIIFLTYSCTNSSKDLTFNEFPAPQRLIGSAWGLDTTLNSPRNIKVIGSKLILIDRKADKFLEIFDGRSRRLIAAAGTKGKGPGEMLTPWSFCGDLKDKNKFWIFDLTLKKLVQFDLDSCIADSGYRPISEVQLSPDFVGAYDASWATDSTIATVVFLGAKRLLFADKSGRLIQRIGSYPGTKPKEIPQDIYAQSYTGILAEDPNEKRLAIASTYADRIDVFSAQGDSLGSAIGPKGFLPDYKLINVYGTIALSHTKKERACYVEACGTKNGIYVLYSGKNREEAGEGFFTGNQIILFDWTGSPRRSFLLDKPLLDFDVDPEGKTIYGLYSESTSDVLQYAID